MAMGGFGAQGAKQIFRLHKDWTNAPASFETSESQRAMEIKSIMRHQRQQTAAGFEEGEVFADPAVEKAQSD